MILDIGLVEVCYSGTGDSVGKGHMLHGLVTPLANAD